MYLILTGGCSNEIKAEGKKVFTEGNKITIITGNEISGEINLSKDWINGDSAEFELLFKRYANEHDKQGSPMNPLEFRNITPKAAFEETKAQVFKNKTSCYSFLVYDGNLYVLGIGFGGFGIIDIKTCDFNNDGKKDLLYSYSWGSGLHRSEIGCFNLSSKTEEKIQILEDDKPGLVQEELIFEKITESNFKVYRASTGLNSPSHPNELILKKGNLLGEIRSIQNKPVLSIK